VRETIRFPSRRTVLRRSLAAACALSPLATGMLLAQGRIEGRDKRPIIHPDGLKFGTYDPHGDFKNDRNVTTEHIFVPWEDVDLAPLSAADQYAWSRGRNIMITIEPWSWSQEWNVGSTELRNLILSGKRDANMRAMLSVVAGFKSEVTIRWAQEMDHAQGRFKWSNWNASDYIEAYRRMMAIAREMLPRAQLMWSPRGETNLQSYYPGPEYVDIVGLSVFGLDQYDVIEHGKPRTFAEALKQGYDLTVGNGKPIWVAELGYEGALAYVTDWADDVTKAFAEYGALKQVNYFNSREVWPWPHGLGLPNWRVVADQAPASSVRR